MITEKLFRWRLDSDGDLTLSVCGFVHLTYYKWADTTVVTWGRQNYRDAPKSLYRAIQAHTRQQVDND